MKFSLETVFQIWNDADGCRVEVGPDSDGFGCIEIRARDEKGNVESRLTLNPDQVPLLIESLQFFVSKGGAV